METQIKTVEAAFSYTNRDLAVMEAFKSLPENDRAHFEADYKLKVAIEALNKEDNNGEAWKPNFDGNNEQRELWVWIKNNPDGVSFVVDDTNSFWTYTNANVGSRHVLKSMNVFHRLKENFMDLITDTWTK